MPSVEDMILSYKKHKNLKISAAELGMNFQTLYWLLKKNGVCVSGDKERYGSQKDKLAKLAEDMFCEIISWAENSNDTQWQSKVDFIINGIKVDVKASKRQKLGIGRGGDRWSFSIKKQIVIADFFVMFALDVDKNIEKIFLIPAGLIASMSSISICCNGKSKWHAYEVSKKELKNIMSDISKTRN